VLKILLDNPDGLPAKTVIEQLKQVVPPTEFEKRDYASTPGLPRYPKMIRFATIGPAKIGWMIKDKGKWRATPEGEMAYRSYQDPEAVNQEVHRLWNQWKAAKKSIEQSEPTGSEEEEAGTLSTYEEAEETAWSEIEKHVQSMNPYDLQRLVAALLRGMGYHVSWVAPPGPDKGIDIVAHNDPLGTSAPRIKVQVKRRADKINVDGLRSFMAILAEQDIGIFVSTGGFTSDAESEARTKETRKLTLLDLEKLVELWVKNYEKIEESDKRLLPLKSVYYLAPSD
jgi:restriction system protein